MPLGPRGLPLGPRPQLLKSRKFRGHTWLEASLACSSANLRALVSAAVTTALCAFRDCDRRSTSDSKDVTWNSRPLTLWDGRRVRENGSSWRTCNYRSDLSLPVLGDSISARRCSLGMHEIETTPNKKRKYSHCDARQWRHECLHGPDRRRPYPFRPTLRPPPGLVESGKNA